MVLTKNAFTSNVQTPNVPAPKIKIPSSKTQKNDFDVGSVLSKGHPPLVRTVTLTKAHLDERKEIETSVNLVITAVEVYDLNKESADWLTVNVTFFSTEKLTKKSVFGVRSSHWIYLERSKLTRYNDPDRALQAPSPVYRHCLQDTACTISRGGHMGCRPQHYAPTDMAPGSRFKALSPVISPAHQMSTFGIHTLLHTFTEVFINSNKLVDWYSANFSLNIVP
ncbi:hypothetical protein J6590_081603 [Homalodisca vitripennis]|nr:hypothetical protein J6590_081603 [Homalodisca vitripennis]